MPMTFVKPEELDSYIGKSLEPSEWLAIDQERINNFADATNDHQFIHVDPEQAEPIFGSTIAQMTSSLSARMCSIIQWRRKASASDKGNSISLLSVPSTRM